MAVVYDPALVAFEIREQLASEKRRLGFLLGAGTSVAVGFPNVRHLTHLVRERLAAPLASVYQQVFSALPDSATVEDVLSRVRLCRELASSGATDSLATARLCGQEVDTGNGGVGRACGPSCVLDRRICQAISDCVIGDPPGGIAYHRGFATWTRHVPRTYPIEVFTPNYDVLLESAMEAAQTPFFDGFVGSVTPFFAAECVDADPTGVSATTLPPSSWVRLWKLHGSIGWHVVNVAGARRITRLAPNPTLNDVDLMIFPSREKYMESRRLPFVVYHDRLRRFLSAGEALLVVLGYSFGDAHINEALFEGLRANSRLAVTALTFDPPSPVLLEAAQANRNLSVYGPDAVVVAGALGEWRPPVEAPDSIPRDYFWQDDPGIFTLGDFRAFARYLDIFALPARRSGTRAGTAASDAVLAGATLGVGGE